MKTKQIFRTLCLVALMCMVSANALAYEIYNGIGDIYVSPGILVVEEDATVNHCNVSYGGVLIIGKNATLTVVVDRFYCSQGTIYVYGTLNLNLEETYSTFSQSTVYVMQGGSLVGSYNETGDNTISHNVDPAAVGSFVKVDAQVPTPANSFVGWPDYYQQRIYSTDGTDFYPIAYYEDAAHTQPIVDLDAWKTNYSNPYHAAYDAGYDAGQLKGDSIGYARGKEEGKAEALGSMGEPCTGCPAVKVKKGDKVVTLYAPESVDYIKIEE